MSNFKDKRILFTSIANVIAISICVLGVALNRLISLYDTDIIPDQIAEFWYVEMVAISIGFLLVKNLKVRFYLFLAAILTYFNNSILVLYLQSSLNSVVLIHYLYIIAVYASNYVALKYGPVLIGRFLHNVLEMDTSAGYFVSSTDVYIVKLHRYMVVFHCLVCIEHILRHSNPIPEIINSSQMMVFYDLTPFSLTFYLVSFYGLLAREAIFTPRD